jgi:hypothetical protein
MARRSDGDEDLRGRLPRLLDAFGQGLLLAGVGLFIAALTGASVAGGAWYGATLSTLGLFTRAAAYVIEAHAIEHRGIVLPPQRSPRDGRSLATEQELVQLFELEQAAGQAHFVARLEDEQRGTGTGRGV